MNKTFCALIQRDVTSLRYLITLHTQKHPAGIQRDFTSPRCPSRGGRGRKRERGREGDRGREEEREGERGRGRKREGGEEGG